MNSLKIFIFIGLAAFALNASAQHERVIVETSPLARVLLLQDSVQQIQSLLGVGTNIQITNVTYLTASNLTLPIGASTGAFWNSTDGNGDGAWTKNGAALTNLNAANLVGVASNISITGSYITNTILDMVSFIPTNAYNVVGSITTTAASQVLTCTPGLFASIPSLGRGWEITIINSPFNFSQYTVIYILDSSHLVLNRPLNQNFSGVVTNYIQPPAATFYDDTVGRQDWVGWVGDNGAFGITCQPNNDGKYMYIVNTTNCMWTDATVQFDGPRWGVTAGSSTLSANILGVNYNAIGDSLYIGPDSIIQVRYGFTNRINTYLDFWSPSRFQTNLYANGPVISAGTNIISMGTTLSYAASDTKASGSPGTFTGLLPGDFIVLNNASFPVLSVSVDASTAYLARTSGASYTNVAWSRSPASYRSSNLSPLPAMEVANNGSVIIHNDTSDARFIINGGASSNSAYFGIYNAGANDVRGALGTGIRQNIISFNLFSPDNALQVQSNGMVSVGIALTNVIGTAVNIASPLVASNTATFILGISSQAANAPVFIQPSGITNNFGVSGTAYVTCTNGNWTNFNFAGTAVLTNIAITVTNMSIHVQAGGSLKAAAAGSMSGTLIPD